MVDFDEWLEELHEIVVEYFGVFVEAVGVLEVGIA